MEENFTLTYLCKFDENGTRGETYDTAGMSKEEKQSKLDDGFIEITEEEWHYLVGNKGAGDNGTGYIYDVANKEVKSAPPAPEPTKEERLSQLDAQYNADKAELSKYYVEAVLSGNTDAQTDIKAELDALTTEYDKKRVEIEGNKKWQ